MTRSPSYYMLMASLPPLPPRFTVPQTPISRRQLERRLSLLTEEDGRELSGIRDVMHWDRYPLEMSDEAIVRQAEEIVPRVRSGTLRELVEWRLERRTVVAALRRKLLGGEAPRPGESWGYGRWVSWVERNWSDPDFGLSRVLPWVPEVRQGMERGDAVSVERTVLGFSWTTLCQAHQQHYFDYEAVVIYVLRWNVIERWTTYDGHRARARFEHLMREGMGEQFTDVFRSEQQNKQVV